MKKIFCEICNKEVKVDYIEKMVCEKIENVEINYLKKYYLCSECNNEIFGDLWDYNIKTINEKLREKNDIITIKEIEEISKKYNIGLKPLSLVLGLGEVTISRYIKGYNPTKEISDLLKAVLKNPYIYEMFLISNKNRIKEVAFKKSLGKTKQIELSTNNSKIYNISLYILKMFSETTPLALQKILYFANGFAKDFLGNRLFDDKAQAWVHGPVYEDIYNCFSYYRRNNIDYEEIFKNQDFDLTDSEKEYLDNIILNFGCYSAEVLREMSHLTEPWIKAREGLKSNENSRRLVDDNDIKDYFDNIIKKYNIKELSDIKKYSKNLFEEALIKFKSKEN